MSSKNQSKGSTLVDLLLSVTIIAAVIFILLTVLELSSPQQNEDLAGQSSTESVPIDCRRLSQIIAMEEFDLMALRYGYSFHRNTQRLEQAKDLYSEHKCGSINQ